MLHSPLALWQPFVDGGDSARFSLSTGEEPTELPVQSGAAALESLRTDVNLALFNQLTSASIEHPHLAPFLMDGLDNALEHLSRGQSEQELRELQWWLCQLRRRVLSEGEKINAKNRVKSAGIGKNVE